MHLSFLTMKANKEQPVPLLLHFLPSFRKAQLSLKGTTKASIDLLPANNTALFSDLSPAFKRFAQVMLHASICLPQFYFSFRVFNLSYKVLKDPHSLFSICYKFKK